VLVSCAAYFFDPEDGSDVTPKRRLTLNRLDGVISQKMVFFRTADVPAETGITHLPDASLEYHRYITPSGNNVLILNS
jgi:hypothetical protein